MKLFLKIFAAVASALCLLFLLGFVLPVLFSAKSTIAVALGTAISALLVSFAISYFFTKK